MPPYLTEQLERALDIWLAGGWAMYALAFVALVMFGLATNIWLRMADRRPNRVPESVWRRWIDVPDEREGRLGAQIDTATSTGRHADVPALFAGLRASDTVPLERDLKILRISVSAAPLVGLLGTVTGMLATFRALSTGSGGDRTMSMVADGISEALITTETGLVIALPGLFLQYVLTRNLERYGAFLAHLESVVTQTLFRRTRGGRAAA